MVNARIETGGKGRRIIVAAILTCGTALAVGVGVAVKYGYLPGYVLFQTTGEGLAGNERQLHVEAEKGGIGQVKRLFRLGVDVNVKDADGWSPLMRAAASGRADMVELLL